jgi:hypothetical protein
MVFLFLKATLQLNGIARNYNGTEIKLIIVLSISNSIYIALLFLLYSQSKEEKRKEKGLILFSTLCVFSLIMLSNMSNPN